MICLYIVQEQIKGLRRSYHEGVEKWERRQKEDKNIHVPFGLHARMCLRENEASFESLECPLERMSFATAVKEVRQAVSKAHVGHDGRETSQATDHKKSKLHQDAAYMLCHCCEEWDEFSEEIEKAEEAVVEDLDGEIDLPAVVENFNWDWSRLADKPENIIHENKKRGCIDWESNDVADADGDSKKKGGDTTSETREKLKRVLGTAKKKLTFCKRSSNLTEWFKENEVVQMEKKKGPTEPFLDDTQKTRILQRVVITMRTMRMGMIHSKSQYQFLYQYVSWWLTRLACLENALPDDAADISFDQPPEHFAKVREMVYHPDEKRIEGWQQLAGRARDGARAARQSASAEDGESKEAHSGKESAGSISPTTTEVSSSDPTANDLWQAFAARWKGYIKLPHDKVYCSGNLCHWALLLASNGITCAQGRKTGLHASTGTESHKRLFAFMLEHPGENVKSEKRELGRKHVKPGGRIWWGPPIDKKKKKEESVYGTAKFKYVAKAETDGTPSFLGPAEYTMLHLAVMTQDVETVNRTVLFLRKKFEGSKFKSVVNRMTKLLPGWINREPDKLCDGTPLHLAASVCNPDVVRVLLLAGADCSIVTGDEKYKTVLHIVAQFGMGNVVECTRLFLMAGANIEAQDYKGWSPLITAAREPKNKSDLVEALCLFGANKDYRPNPPEGNDDVSQNEMEQNNQFDLATLKRFRHLTALRHAVSLNIVENVKALVTNGADPDIQGPPHIEGIDHHVSCLELAIFEYGWDGSANAEADIMSPIEARLSLLHKKAEEHAENDAVGSSGESGGGQEGKLQDEGQDSENQDSELQQLIEMIEIVFNMGAYEACSVGGGDSPSSRNASPKDEADIGAQPLHFAINRKAEEFEIVERLVHEKSDINAATTTRGLTPLHIAACRGHVKIVALLIEYNANVRVETTKFKLTALHFAANMSKNFIEENTFEMTLDWIFLKNINVQEQSHAKINSDLTKFTSWAKKGKLLLIEKRLSKVAAPGSYSICKLLVDQHADLNARDKKGLTPLHFAFDYLKDPSSNAPDGVADLTLAFDYEVDGKLTIGDDKGKPGCAAAGSETKNGASASSDGSVVVKGPVIVTIEFNDDDFHGVQGADDFLGTLHLAFKTNDAGSIVEVGGYTCPNSPEANEPKMEWSVDGRLSNIIIEDKEASLELERRGLALRYRELHGWCRKKKFGGCFGARTGTADLFVSVTESLKSTKAKKEGCIKIFIRKVAGLADTDLFNRPDPYCIGRLFTVEKKGEDFAVTHQASDSTETVYDTQRWQLKTKSNSMKCESNSGSGAPETPLPYRKVRDFESHIAAPSSSSNQHQHIGSEIVTSMKIPPFNRPELKRGRTRSLSASGAEMSAADMRPGACGAAGTDAKSGADESQHQLINLLTVKGADLEARADDGSIPFSDLDQYRWYQDKRKGMMETYLEMGRTSWDECAKDPLFNDERTKKAVQTKWGDTIRDDKVVRLATWLAFLLISHLFALQNFSLFSGTDAYFFQSVVQGPLLETRWGERGMEFDLNPKTFEDIETPDDFWGWCEHVLVDTLYGEDGEAVYRRDGDEAKLVAVTNTTVANRGARLVGRPRLRQLRRGEHNARCFCLSKTGGDSCANSGDAFEFVPGDETALRALWGSLYWFSIEAFNRDFLYGVAFFALLLYWFIDELQEFASDWAPKELITKKYGISEEKLANF
eukprot:g4450.t1